MHNSFLQYTELFFCLSRFITFVSQGFLPLKVYLYRESKIVQPAILWFFFLGPLGLPGGGLRFAYLYIGAATSPLVFSVPSIGRLRWPIHAARHNAIEWRAMLAGSTTFPDVPSVEN